MFGSCQPLYRKKRFLCESTPDLPVHICCWCSAVIGWKRYPKVRFPKQATHKGVLLFGAQKAKKLVMWSASWSNLPQKNVESGISGPRKWLDTFKISQENLFIVWNRHWGFPDDKLSHAGSAQCHLSGKRRNIWRAVTLFSYYSD